MPVNPSDNEQEYFQREQVRKLRESRAQARAEMAEDDRESLKKRHWMHCPKCGMDLHTVEFHGVEVDTCFGCEGMFLDKGEIEKILKHDHPGVFGQLYGLVFNPND